MFKPYMLFFGDSISQCLKKGFNLEYLHGTDVRHRSRGNMRIRVTDGKIGIEDLEGKYKGPLNELFFSDYIITVH